MSRRLAHPFLATAIGLGTVLGFAAPAFAHHTTVTGVLACDQAGNQVINWTVSNSEAGKKMTLDKVELTSSTNISPLTVGYAVNDLLNESENRARSTTVPGTAAGSVKLEIDASWPGNDANDARIQDDGKSDVVQLDPNKCKGAAVPNADVAQDCVNGGVNVVLRNTGGTAVTFVVHKDGTPVAEDKSVAVDPGGTVPVPYSLAEGASAVFSVSAPGMTPSPKTLNVTRDCQKPGATATLDCQSGLIITLTNLGGQSPVDVTVLVNGVSTIVPVPANPNSLPANNVVLDDYNIGEDQVVNAKVSVPPSTDAIAGISSQKNDCQNPVAAITAACDKGAIVTLSNTGGQKPVIFTIMKNNQVIDTVTVAAGGAKEDHLYTMDEDETSTYAVKVGETVLATQEITNNCLIPSATIVDSCESAGAMVTLTNGGVLPVEFTVLKDGTEVAKKTVVKGSPQSLTFPMDEDVTANFTVKAAGESMADVTRTFKHDCQLPAASFAYSCDKGVAMVFTNAGELPVDFTITKGGNALADGGTVSVPAEGSVSRTYTITENEAATYTVSAPGLAPVSATFSQNCQNPVAAIGPACPGPLVVTLTNLGGLLPVDFTVLVNGVSSKVNVPANGKVESPFVLVEDATANVKISAVGMSDTTSTFVRDCAQVLGVTLTQPDVGGAVLPRTGSQPGSLVPFAAALAVVGLGLRWMTRRPKSTD